MAKINSLWDSLEQIYDNLDNKRLAEVFRLVSFSPNESFGPHKHVRIEINYVQKGDCHIRIADELTIFHEGEIMIISSNIDHFFQAGSNGATLLQLEFLPEILFGFTTDSSSSSTKIDLESLFCEKNRLIRIVNNRRILQSIQNIVHEMESKNPFYRNLVVMYYAELLILLYRYMNEVYHPLCTNELFQKALSFIHLNYQTSISVQDVANHCQVSNRYLRYLFDRYLQVSPLEYLNKIRISKAVELLRDTNLSVKEVGFQCGFRSPQYFSRVFRQYRGYPPSKTTV